MSQQQPRLERCAKPLDRTVPAAGPMIGAGIASVGFAALPAAA